MSEMEAGAVLITGASRGLGAALARAFGAAGGRVAVCARDAAALRPVAEAVRRAGGECLARAVDVADEAAVSAWVEEAARELGRPRVLINNASVLGPRVPLVEHPVDQWRATLDVNLTGAFVTARACLPAMLSAGDGVIVNVSSGAALPPRRHWGAYAVAKAALEALTANLAAELEGTGVRVNAVDPGAMRTGMRAAAYPDEDPGDVKPPEAIAELFLWLASDRARGVTGQRFQADRWRPGSPAPGRPLGGA